MAYVSSDAQLSAARPALGFFGALVARYDAWRTYQRTVAELSKLSDRELDDIGITRGAIRYYARTGR